MDTRLGPDVDSGAGKDTSPSPVSGSCVRQMPRGPEVTARARQSRVHIPALRSMDTWTAPGPEMCTAMLATVVR